MNPEPLAPPPREVYQRMSQRPELCLCRQNQHIAAQFEAANFAVIELIRRNVVVLSIHIEDSKPLIEVEQCKAVEKLPHTVGTIDFMGKVVKRGVAVFNHCTIVWIAHKDTQL